MEICAVVQVLLSLRDDVVQVVSSDDRDDGSVARDLDYDSGKDSVSDDNRSTFPVKFPSRAVLRILKTNLGSRINLDSVFLRPPSLLAHKIRPSSSGLVIKAKDSQPRVRTPLDTRQTALWKYFHFEKDI